MVFIHGLSDSLLYWEFLAANLKNDFQVLRVDLRGHGESELGNDEISIGTYASDLHGLLDELGIGKINLIGFSLGGAVALDFTLRYPEMVDSLVLMSSFYKADEHLENVFTQFSNALKSGFEDFYDLILPMVFCPDVIDENRQDLEMLKKIASPSANVQAYIRAIDAGRDFDVEDGLSLIAVPTLVLAGRHDEITLLSMQRELERKIVNSELVVFDDVRHNLLVGKNNEKILEILKNRYK